MARSWKSILEGKYPAKAHAKRVADYLAAHGKGHEGVIYIESQKSRLHEDCDQEAPFRQRRPFFYLSGCELPDSYLTYNISTTELALYIPPISPDDVVWSGLPKSPEAALKEYDVDKVYTADNLNATLSHIASASTTGSGPKTIFAIPEQVSEHVTFLAYDNKDFSILKKAIDDTRFVKDEYEIALIRHANEVSAAAHQAAYDLVSSAKNEADLYATFIATCMAKGCPEQAYSSIVASGTNAATLHYVKNNEPFDGRENVLLDAGAEYRCYASDITRTFPISGKFSRESQQIYDTVKEMQAVSFGMLKEGVLWEDVHIATHKVAIRRLKEFGILVGDEQEIFDNRVSVAFYPHGLGHSLGMATHDTGGNANYADKDSMFRYLRVRGRLPAGCVITAEPGIYFCRFILDPVLQDPNLSKYIDQKILEQYWKVGGVRIEDNVVITKDGYDNLTTAFKL